MIQQRPSHVPSTKGMGFSQQKERMKRRLDWHVSPSDQGQDMLSQFSVLKLTYTQAHVPSTWI